MTETASNPPFLFNSDNFIAIPRDIFVHQMQSRISAPESQLYQVLLFQADYQTGLWRGTVSKVMEVLPCSDKSISAWLVGLHEKKYVKSFHTQGVKGLYYVAIHGYFIRTGKYAQHQLDAWATSDPRHPVYRPYNPDASPGEAISPEVISGEKGSPEPSPEASPEPSPVKTSDYSRSKMSINKNGGGGGGEKPLNSLEDQKANPSGKDSLLSEMRAIFDHHKIPGWNTTPAHEARAAELSAQYGKRIFLQAFDAWCHHDASDQVETKNYDSLKFPVQKFFGQVAHYTKVAQEDGGRRSKPNACPIVREMEAACSVE